MTPRRAVAAQLEELNASGGPLSVDSPQCTNLLYGDGISRMRVQRELINDFLASQDVDRDGRAVVVTAGAPGAGKSVGTATLRAQLGGTWRVVDPDYFKIGLIRRALDSGIYDDLLEIPLADSRPVMPLELASLVHAESFDVFKLALDQCMRQGENVIIEGTLRWPGMVTQHSARLGRFGYGEAHILSVEVPLEVALAQAEKRWWSDRDDPDKELGGRFVPAAVIRDCYETGHARTICHENAIALTRKLRQDRVAARLVMPDELTSNIVELKVADTGS